MALNSRQRRTRAAKLAKIDEAKQSDTVITSRDGAVRSAWSKTVTHGNRQQFGSHVPHNERGSTPSSKGPKRFSEPSKGLIDHPLDVAGRIGSHGIRND